MFAPVIDTIQHYRKNEKTITSVPPVNRCILFFQSSFDQQASPLIQTLRAGIVSPKN
jgi:hypothetical protein